METAWLPLMGAVIAIAGLMLGMFYWNDRRNERRIDRLEARWTRQLADMEARYNQQLRDSEARQNHRLNEMNQQLKDSEDRQNLRLDEMNRQLKESEARQNLRLDEMNEQLKELNDWAGNLDRGQSRLEGQLDVIRDAVFQRSPG